MCLLFLTEKMSQEIAPKDSSHSSKGQISTEKPEIELILSAVLANTFQNRSIV